MKYLVLDQYRENSEYNDFVGKFYHFPKKYLSYFPENEFEFIYYEPKTKGDGVYFGYGKVTKKPFEDKQVPDTYFIEIAEYKEFATPVPGPLEIPPSYNAQNAVRKIEENLFEQICLKGNIQLNFQADAHLIQILGEQLIASEKVGILELIKNAYDAHASYCNVYIENIPSLNTIDEENYLFPEYQSPVIVIEDDGIGMDRNVIEKGWLRPASRLKTNIKEKLKQERKEALENGTLGEYDSLIKILKQENRGRIPLGEKGVGRFATHRLGNHLTLITKTPDKTFEYVLKIDWSKFDHNSVNQNVNLEDIGISLGMQNPSRDYGEKGSGTRLIIYGGKEGFDWDEQKIRELNDAIIRLNSPRKINSAFKAKLICPQIIDLTSSVLNDDYPPIFNFEGLIDNDGNLDYKLTFMPPKSVPMNKELWEDGTFDLKVSNNEYWTKDGKPRRPECGPFYISIDVWYREKPWIDGPNSKGFKDYLEDFGGISIYRDGINIYDAQKAKHDDWLGLSARQSKQAYRIGYRYFIGSIDLQQENNINLVDKTNREGFIENLAYHDLRELVLSIINLVESRYRDKRDKYKAMTEDIIRDPKKLTEYTKQSAQITKDIVNSDYPLMEDPYKILSSLSVENRKDQLINLERSLKNLQKSLDAMEESKELLSEQAGFGLAIAVSVHEIAKITSNFYHGVNDILKRGINENKLEELKEASSSLRSELKRLTPLRVTRAENRLDFALSKAVNYVLDVFKTKIEKNGIEISVDFEEDIQVYARFGAVLQVITNIIDNSIYWLNSPGIIEKKLIIKFNSKHRYIIIADSGSGINESILPYLFEPGYSLKVPASGLGLYICKYYMQEMYGNVYLTLERERLNLPGAQFTLDFGRTPVRKENAL